MKKISCVFAAVSACVLFGCSIHPLPEDVTRETTTQIIHKIRCEAREGLTNLSLRVLRLSDNPRTLALADRVEAGELSLIDIFDNAKLRRDVDPKVHRHFNVFALSAVAWDFTFTGTETNDGSASADFRSLHGNAGKFTLGAKAGTKLERTNERRVVFTDSFLELYDQIEPQYCQNIVARGKNYIYPIVGKIGLEELFESFVRLSSRDLDQNTPGDLGTFADTMTFKTGLNAGIDPKIELAPGAADSFRLTGGSLGFGADRTDTHKLFVTVSMGRLVSSLADARNPMSQVRQSASNAKKRALQDLKDLKTENFYSTVKRIERTLPPQ